MSQRNLAEKLGISENRVGQYEYAKAPVGMYVSNFRKLAEAFDLDPDELKRKLSPDPDENVVRTTEMKVEEIPMFDMAVAAGGWVEVTEVAEVFGLQIDRGRFRIRIAGDSMEPAYKNGATIEFVTVRFGRDLLKVGAAYYVQRSDGCASFKIVAATNDDGITLQAINRHKYPDAMSVAWQEVARVAMAVAIVQIIHTEGG